MTDNTNTTVEYSYFERARINMVKNQLMTLDINNMSLLESFLAVPRELFLSDKYTDIAYLDTTIADDHNMMLRPESLYRMLNGMQLKKSDKLLIVGAGYGYLPILLAGIVRSVLAVENDKNALNHFRNNMANVLHGQVHNVKVKSGCDVEHTFMEEAPFDKIIINTPNNRPVSDLITSQLEKDGVIVTLQNDETQGVVYQTFKKVNNQLVQI